MPLEDLPTAQQAATAAGALGALSALIFAFFRMWPKLFEVQAGSDRALRRDLAARISHLEERDKRCDRLLTKLNRQLIVVAHSTMELGSVVEKYEPGSPAVARAKRALRAAFPLDDDPSQGGLYDLAREVEEKDR